jgi:hypothetical protein
MLSSWRMYEMHPALSFKTGCYIARDKPRAADAVTARRSATSDEQRVFDSPEGVSGDAPEGANSADQPYEAHRPINSADQLCEADQPTNSAWQTGRPTSRRPTHCRAIERVCEAGRTTESPSSGSARKESGPTSSSHDSRDKTQR